MLSREFLPELFPEIGGILNNLHGKLIAAGGTTDHVHLLASLDRTTSPADAMRVVKSNSSLWIHDTFPDQSGFAWQTGYGVFAVSYSHIAQVRAYLARQEAHHRRVTFQEEFRAFLDRHDIAYDERYVWD